jgi:hypothetical protein
MDARHKTPALVIESDEIIRAYLSVDNQEIENPLPRRVADLLWD